MPRLRQPPAKPADDKLPEIETFVAPDGDIEIELPGDETGPAEVELKTPVAAAVVAEPAPEASALQKALEAQQRAEEMARNSARERDDAVRRVNERDRELEHERGRSEDAEYNGVLTAMAAEESTLAKAEADYAAHAQSGDWTQAAAAQRIMATASSRLDRLGDNKHALDSRRETSKTTAPPVPQRTAPQDFEQKLTALQVPDSAKTWLRAHPEFINDSSKTDDLGAVHNYLTKTKRIANFSQDYFDALDTEFGFKTAPAAQPNPAAQTHPQQRSIPVSAPVSRDIPTPSGQRAPSSKITLTEEERRIARTAYSAPDMTDAQKEYAYAQNKRKLQVSRANGSYPQPERN